MKTFASGSRSARLTKLPMNRWLWLISLRRRFCSLRRSRRLGSSDSGMGVPFQRQPAFLSSSVAQSAQLEFRFLQPLQSMRFPLGGDVLLVLVYHKHNKMEGLPLRTLTKGNPSLFYVKITLWK